MKHEYAGDAFGKELLFISAFYRDILKFPNFEMNLIRTELEELIDDMYDEMRERGWDLEDYKETLLSEKKFCVDAREAFKSVDGGPRIGKIEEKLAWYREHDAEYVKQVLEEEARTHDVVLDEAVLKGLEEYLLEFEKIFQEKSGAEPGNRYCGPVVAFSKTHAAQEISADGHKSVVVHKLKDIPDLPQLFETLKLEKTDPVVIDYGLDGKNTIELLSEPVKELGNLSSETSKDGEAEVFKVGDNVAFRGKKSEKTLHGNITRIDGNTIAFQTKNGTIACKRDAIDMEVLLPQPELEKPLEKSVPSLVVHGSDRNAGR
jgi:hypothetical protein